MREQEPGDVVTHRSQTLAAMAAVGIDVLLLGREANARYVSGATRLSLAGTRPFAPGCVLVRATGEVHLLSITDDGIPADVPHANLFPITWNPMAMLAAVAAAMEGNEVHRIGVDGMSPLFEALLGMTFPGAELVDAEALLREVRRVKSPIDLSFIRIAGAVVNTALGLTLDEANADADLRARFLEHVGDLKLPTTPPSFTPVVRRVGERTSMRVGVVHHGWEAAMARHRPLDDALVAAAAAAVSRCRAGTPLGDVRTEAVAVEGIGLGHEELEDGAVLEPGMTLSVLVRGPSGLEWGDTIAVTDDEPELLDSMTVARLSATSYDVAD